MGAVLAIPECSVLTNLVRRGSRKTEPPTHAAGELINETPCFNGKCTPPRQGIVTGAEINGRGRTGFPTDSR